MDNNLQTLIENKALLEGMVNAQSPEELQSVFKENNIELEEGLTIEEAFRIAKDSQNQSDEILETELENVSGGILITAGAAACFIIGSAMVGFLSSYGYRTIKGWRKQ